MWLTANLTPKKDKIAALGLKWEMVQASSKEGSEVLLHFQHNEFKDKLSHEGAFASINEINFMPEKIKITFHHANLKCETLEKKIKYESDFKNEVSIGGWIRDPVNPITFSRSELIDKGVLYINLRIPVEDDSSITEKHKPKLIGIIDIIPRNIKDPKYFDFIDGRLRLYKNISIELKDEKKKDSISLIGSVDGKEKLEEITINDFGIESNFEILTDDIKINNDQRQITAYEFILTKTFLISFIIFFLWFADKVIGILGPVWVEDWKKRKDDKKKKEQKKLEEERKKAQQTAAQNTETE